MVRQARVGLRARQAGRSLARVVAAAVQPVQRERVDVAETAARQVVAVAAVALLEQSAAAVAQGRAAKSA